METKAKVKHIKMSPRKVRLVINIVRGKNVEQAIDQLKFTQKLAAKPVIKLINSAVANAKHNLEIEQDNLYIKEIQVDEGPTLHRWMPRAHGRATPIRKRTSHISLILAEIKESSKKTVKKQKIEAPIKLDVKPKEDRDAKVADDKKEIAEENETQPKKKIDLKTEDKAGYPQAKGKGQSGFVNKFFRRKSG